MTIPLYSHPLRLHLPPWGESDCPHLRLVDFGYLPRVSIYPAVASVSLHTPPQVLTYSSPDSEPPECYLSTNPNWRGKMLTGRRRHPALRQPRALDGWCVNCTRDYSNKPWCQEKRQLRRADANCCPWEQLDWILVVEMSHERVGDTPNRKECVGHRGYWWHHSRWGEM